MIVGADPNKNYRFIINAQNKDGVSPWSNMVEWGARRQSSAVFWHSISDSLVRSEYTLASLPSGIWGVRIVKVEDDYELKMFKAPLGWDGSDAALLATFNIPAPSLLNHTPQISDVVTLFPVVTEKYPMWFIRYRNADSSFVRLIRVKMPSGNAPSYETIQVAGLTATDYLPMEDGLLFVKTVSSWYAVRPSITGTYATTPINLNSVRLIPYLRNAYPVSLNTYLATVSGNYIPTLRYISDKPDVRYAGNQLNINQIACDLSTPV